MSNEPPLRCRHTFDDDKAHIVRALDEARVRHEPAAASLQSPATVTWSECRHQPKEYGPDTLLCVEVKDWLKD